MTEPRHHENSVEAVTITETSELEPIDINNRKKGAKEIAVSALLASLSIAIAPSASILARASWGIALFDPVSLFWIIAFLIGGYRVGSISMVAGTFGLFIWDPTGIGPMFKFLATLPMIAVPYLLTRKRTLLHGGFVLSNASLYFKVMLVAFVVRLVFMLAVNIVLVPLLYPFVTLEEIVYLTVVLNLFQGTWDAVIPYMIVFKTPLYEHFKLW